MSGHTIKYLPSTTSAPKAFQTKADIKKVANFYGETRASLEAAMQITAESSRLVEEATAAALSDPVCSNRILDSCEFTDNIDILLELIIYALVSGTSKVIDDSLQPLLHPNVPSDCYARALTQLKNLNLSTLSPEANVQVNKYIDHTIAALP